MGVARGAGLYPRRGFGGKTGIFWGDLRGELELLGLLGAVSGESREGDGGVTELLGERGWREGSQGIIGGHGEKELLWGSGAGAEL